MCTKSTVEFVVYSLYPRWEPETGKLFVTTTEQRRTTTEQRNKTTRTNLHRNGAWTRGFHAFIPCIHWVNQRQVNFSSEQRSNAEQRRNNFKTSLEQILIVMVLGRGNSMHLFPVSTE